MKSIKSIKPDAMCETSLLLEFVRRCDRDFQKGRGIPLEQAFVELREQAEKDKVLYADLFNNNRTRGQEGSA